MWCREDDRQSAGVGETFASVISPNTVTGKTPVTPSAVTKYLVLQETSIGSSRIHGVKGVDYVTRLSLSVSGDIWVIHDGPIATINIYDFDVYGESFFRERCVGFEHGPSLRHPEGQTLRRGPGPYRRGQTGPPESRSQRRSTRSSPTG